MAIQRLVRKPFFDDILLSLNDPDSSKRLIGIPPEQGNQFDPRLSTYP
jgi:hypothetical protein